VGESVSRKTEENKDRTKGGLVERGGVERESEGGPESAKGCGSVRKEEGHKIENISKRKGKIKLAKSSK